MRRVLYLETSVFENVLVSSNLTKGTDLSIAKLVDDKGTVVPYEYDDVESVYHFRDANGVYVDGSFKADIKISESNASYPGVVICNVPLTVTPATFDATVKYDDQEHGNSFKIEVNGVEKKAPIITGLKKGDVIIGANQQAVKNIAELRKVLDSKPSVLALNIQRGDSSIYLLMQ